MTLLEEISIVYYQIDSALFTVDSDDLSYTDVTELIIDLANKVNDYTDDLGDLWYLGEHTNCCLAELITGAFWHYTEYHQGQSSLEYAALSALGKVFNPGMSTVEQDNEAYQALNLLAED